MRRFIHVVLLFLFVSGFFAAAVFLSDPLRKAGVMLVALVGTVTLCFVDFAFARQQAMAVRRRNEQRTAELARRLAATGEVYAIQGMSNFVPGIFFVLLGSLFLFVLPHDILPLLLGALILSAGILSFVLGVQGFGRPVLELSRSGFSTPIHGHIPWSEVGGISLQTLTYRGATISHMLVLRVPQVSRFSHQFAAMQAFFISRRSHPTRQNLTVALRRSSEHPDVVLNLAKELLRKATGRDHIGS